MKEKTMRRYIFTRHIVCSLKYLSYTYINTQIYSDYHQNENKTKPQNAIFYDKTQCICKRFFFRTVVIIEIRNEANYFRAVSIVLKF